MPISLPVPNDVTEFRPLSQLLKEILRRALDGTTGNFQNGVTVTGGDFKVMNAGSGLVMVTRTGGYYARILLENPDGHGNMALAVDPIGAPSGISAGDIQVLDIGGGFVVPCRNGSQYGRIILEQPDGNGNIDISADPGATFNPNKDIEVLTAGFGMVLPCRNGSKYGRLLLENPDGQGNLTISVDPI